MKSRIDNRTVVNAFFAQTVPDEKLSEKGELRCHPEAAKYFMKHWLEAQFRYTLDKEATKELGAFVYKRPEAFGRIVVGFEFDMEAIVKVEE